MLKVYNLLHITEAEKYTQVQPSTIKSQAYSEPNKNLGEHK